MWRSLIHLNVLSFLTSLPSNTYFRLLKLSLNVHPWQGSVYKHHMFETYDLKPNLNTTVTKQLFSLFGFFRVYYTVSNFFSLIRCHWCRFVQTTVNSPANCSFVQSWCLQSSTRDVLRQNYNVTEFIKYRYLRYVCLSVYLCVFVPDQCSLSYGMYCWKEKNKKQICTLQLHGILTAYPYIYTNDTSQIGQQECSSTKSGFVVVAEVLSAGVTNTTTGCKVWFIVHLPEAKISCFSIGKSCTASLQYLMCVVLMLLFSTGVSHIKRQKKRKKYIGVK